MAVIVTHTVYGRQRPIDLVIPNSTIFGYFIKDANTWNLSEIDEKCKGPDKDRFYDFLTFLSKHTLKHRIH